MVGVASIPDQAEEREKLQRHPERGDCFVKREVIVVCFEVGVFEVEAQNGIECREEIPSDNRQEQHIPTAQDSAEPGDGYEQQREPERQGVLRAGKLLGGDHAVAPVRACSVVWRR